MVSLTKVVLNILVIGGDTQLDEFIFECSGLLKKAVNLAFNFHLSPTRAAESGGQPGQ